MNVKDVEMSADIWGLLLQVDKETLNYIDDSFVPSCINHGATVICTQTPRPITIKTKNESCL